MDQSAPLRVSVRGIALVLVILAVTAIIIVSMLRDRIVNTPQWTVSIHGEAKVSYEPDLARINLGVQVDNAKTAQDALKKLNTEMQNVIGSIEALGITRDAIQTQNYSLYPNYQYAEDVSTIYGYNANQQVSIKVDITNDTPDMVSRIIETASSNGANQVNGVSFEIKDVETIKQQARLQAIENAQKQAHETAQAVGVRLGKIVGWYENTSGMGGGPMMYDAGYGGGGPIVPSGTPEITVGVDITYKIR